MGCALGKRPANNSSREHLPPTRPPRPTSFSSLLSTSSLSRQMHLSCCEFLLFMYQQEDKPSFVLLRAKIAAFLNTSLAHRIAVHKAVACMSSLQFALGLAPPKSTSYFTGLTIALAKSALHGALGDATRDALGNLQYVIIESKYPSKICIIKFKNKRNDLQSVGESPVAHDERATSRSIANWPTDTHEVQFIFIFL